MTANPEDRPPSIVQTELMNSVGNILSGLMTPLVDYARDAGSAAREGSLDGVKEAAKQGTQVLAWGAVAYFSALAAGLPAQFGWLIPVMALLKLKLKK